MTAFRVLGPLEVRDADGDRLSIPRRKQRALLALLLLRSGATVSIDEIVYSLWGDWPPVSARANLHSYVSSLRQVLARTAPAADPRPVRTVTGYRLELAPGECDADLFEELATAGRRAVAAGEYAKATERLSRALGLWRGPVLDDLPTFDWTTPFVARLEEIRVRAVEDLAGARLHLGQHADLAIELATATGENPFRERLWLHYLEALRRTGDRAQALRAYDRYRTVLDTELGVAPGRAVQELHREIMTENVPPAAAVEAERAAPVRRAAEVTRAKGAVEAVRARGADGVPEPARPPALLPPAVTDFTGRHAELRRLRTLLTPGPGSTALGLTIAGVTGMPGVGKTTLAVQVAHTVAGSFPDGQLFVNLRSDGGSGGPTPLRPAAVLGRFLRALGVPGGAVPADALERTELYRTVLSGRRVLVVLDDAESAEQVRALLPGSATCAVLVTSRARLAGIEGSRWTELGGFTDDEARHMLTSAVRDHRATDRAAAARIARISGGLPLAVRIVAARLMARPDWTLANLATLLSDEHRRLDLLRSGDLDVRASLASSYDRLAHPTRRLLRMLAHLDLPSFPEWLATVVLGGSSDAAAERLATLVDAAHLLTVAGVDETGQVRYRCHDLVRIFARDRSRAEDRPADVRATVERMERSVYACGSISA
jgi:DNA-binding SARP family transcriptional activator